MFWKLFSEKKPKKSGWYQCTVEVPGIDRYVVDLYWDAEVERFKDNSRQDVFNTYDVYAYNEATYEYDKNVNTDQYCDMTTHVVAWKKLPKPYLK